MDRQHFAGSTRSLRLDSPPFATSEAEACSSMCYATVVSSLTSKAAFRTLKAMVRTASDRLIMVCRSLALRLPPPGTPPRCPQPAQ